MDVRERWLGRVQGIFREVLDDDSLEITPETTKENIAQWDSMFQVTLILAIEREFKVRFSAREAASLITVRGILDQLQARNAHC